MTAEQIKSKVKCCATDLPLTSSKHINMVPVRKIAKWKYPTSGNAILGTHGEAVAIIHDKAIKNGALQSPIKFAVEFKGDEIIYHPLDSLDSIPD